MFTIKYDMKQFELFNMNTQTVSPRKDTHLEIYFKYSNEIDISFSIFISSIETDFNKYKWSHLIENININYRFIRKVGNMHQNSFIEIKNIGQHIKFTIYNDIGKNIELNIPIDICKDQFRNFNNIFENEILSKL